MSMTPKNKLRMALVATAVLALAAMSPLVEAKESRGPKGPDADGRGHGKEGVRERMAAQYHAMCDEPANDTSEKRCEKLAQKMGNETKARRHAHALLGAIAAHERILGRIEYKIVKVEGKLAEGNLTGNQTEALEMRLEKLEAMKERQVAKIDELQAKLDALKAKWEAARERADEDEDDDADESDDDADDDPADGNQTADP